MNNSKPQILAPAGDASSYLAAVAAGADAIYAGLKHYSARMQADNFSISELAALAAYAREKGVKTYIPMNTLVKPGEPHAAGRLIDRLNRAVQPDGLIVQDLGMVAVARQAGYEGQIHLSTLANVTHPAALAHVREQYGVDRVVLPRELTIDEIRQCADACPDDMDLEVFVHGALCYAVSGRCYWSSWLGGKSGLRGRCVQPCRRNYTRPISSPKKPGKVQNRRNVEHKGRGKDANSTPPQRLFSCRDLSLDVVAPTLLNIPKVGAWKIEGRKKGPHYVFYTVSAYRLLRDEPSSTQAKKQAADYLEQALGRPGTHYGFIPQKPFPAVTPGESTGSGRFIGSTTRPMKGKCSFQPRLELTKGDLIRIGFEDEPWHRVMPIRASIPRRGRFDMQFEPGKAPAAGTPVFLIDRREPELLKILDTMQKELEQFEGHDPESSEFRVAKPQPVDLPRHNKPRRMDVWRQFPTGKRGSDTAIWIRPGITKDVPRQIRPNIWWWLPPVIWPNEEDSVRQQIEDVLRSRARNFVLNAPWQLSLFPETSRDLNLWAGPFCNIANPLAIEELRKAGFSGAIISPELSRDDILNLPAQSSLPLGLVMGGQWPLGISRTLANEMKTEQPFESPMKETSWVRKYGQTYWIYPDWPLDMSVISKEVAAAGFAMLVNLHETKPRAVKPAQRVGTFNLDNKLL